MRSQGKFMKFIVILMFVYQQFSYPVNQKAPFVSGFEKAQYLNTNEISSMEDFNYKLCDSAIFNPNTGEYTFHECSQTIHKGCKITALAKQGHVYYSSEVCGTWKKITL